MTIEEQVALDSLAMIGINNVPLHQLRTLSRINQYKITVKMRDATLAVVDFPKVAENIMQGAMRHVHPVAAMLRVLSDSRPIEVLMQDAKVMMQLEEEERNARARINAAQEIVDAGARRRERIEQLALAQRERNTARRIP